MVPVPMVQVDTIVCALLALKVLIVRLKRLDVIKSLVIMEQAV